MRTEPRGAAEDILLTHGWLARQPAGFRDEVFARGIVQAFDPGAFIYRIGGPPGGLYGLIRGRIAIGLAPSHSAPRLIQFSKPGFWAGEGPFLTGEPRRAELRAAAACLLFHLPLDAMRQIATRNPEAIRFFARNTVSHFDMMGRIIDDLMIPEARRRIASVLQRAAGFADAPVPVSQADLGAMANASRKQVNAALADFAAQGWVARSYRSIRVTDADALLRFAAGDGA